MDRPTTRVDVILGLALSPALDMTYEVDAIAHGDITRPRRVTRVAGGKTLNMVRVAHVLGAPVHAVAALGGATGAWVATLLAEDGVPATVVPIAAETRICTAVVEDGGAVRSTDLYELAAPVSDGEWQDYVAAVSPIAAKVAVFSGSLPPGVSPHAASRLASSLRAGGMRIVVDCAGATLRTLAVGADLVKINRAEAESLLGCGVADAAAAAHLVRDRFGPAVIVTDGVRGGAAASNEGTTLFAAPRHPGRFPAGSGDAFLAGLLAAHEAGAGMADAIDQGREAAERNALVAGQGVLG